MATDYKSIAEENRVSYGSKIEHRRVHYKHRYSEKTHFVYELIQNSDDSKSQHLDLRLDENELFAWNDGCQFSEKDVRSICSIYSSDKDLTQIGTFGIGFKAVTITRSSRRFTPVMNIFVFDISRSQRALMKSGIRESRNK